MDGTAPPETGRAPPPPVGLSQRLAHPRHRWSRSQTGAANDPVEGGFIWDADVGSVSDGMAEHKTPPTEH